MTDTGYFWWLEVYILWLTMDIFAFCKLKTGFDDAPPLTLLQYLSQAHLGHKKLIPKCLDMCNTLTIQHFFFSQNLVIYGHLLVYSLAYSYDSLYWMWEWQQGSQFTANSICHQMLQVTSLCWASIWYSGTYDSSGGFLHSAAWASLHCPGPPPALLATLLHQENLKVLNHAWCSLNSALSSFQAGKNSERLITYLLFIF